MKTWIVDLKRVSAFASVLLYLHLSTPCFAGVTLETPDLLVGRWECRIEYGSWIIERNADGTFEKKGKLVQTLGQPPQDFAVKGRWRLEGKKYIEIWDQVSPDSWSELKGSTRRAKVLLLQRDKFRRIQSDSPVFIETRIR
jgi:hypothetical protein